jgi:hypothetical protein
MTLSVTVDDDDRGEWWHQDFAPFTSERGPTYWIQ